jgi:hypothetical protein
LDHKDHDDHKDREQRFFVACVIVVVSALSLSIRAVVVPSFSDLTIRRRHVYNESFLSTDTMYLKGARERYEARHEGAGAAIASS